ncbi:prolipoprotein diacylglyceryl transferase [Clostridium sp. MCC353]|uniref:prolipoprotein diacylglyceryl transferase n=1 Tax=Clostridium sp. MCC353 TaxID=2592646 RepID=UPI001C01E8B2|nr:prolipoprotein diacylglyceryl transferase [Clostridium sp. MCC353]
MTKGTDISFVNLGIAIDNLRSSVTVFGFRIAFYAVMIVIGMIAGIWIAQKDAERRGQDPDLYFEFALYAIVCSIIGARIYYVVFAWDNYRDDLWQIFNIRAGGLAIYGGVIAAVITLAVYSKVKKISFFSMADTGVLGLTAGQIIGRWGNFFNCEAFGGYTDGLFAMRIRRALVNESMISQDLVDHLIVEEGVEYIQVHPTFLYESLWNLGLLAFMLWYRKHKKFEGEMMWIYLLGYGFGRFWIEGLRTDQLILFSTGIPVSQALSFVMVVVSAAVIFYQRKHLSPHQASKRNS